MLKCETNNGKRVRTMRRKIIGDVEPKCEYCKHGKLSADKEKILCPKQGVLSKDHSCKKFCYDALKRIPQKTAPALQQFTAEDFEL